MNKSYFEARVLRANEGKKEIFGEIVYNLPSADLGGYYEILKPGVFSRSLKSGDRIYPLWQHKQDQPLGHTDNSTLILTDGPKSLKIRIIPPATSWGRDALESVSRGDVSAFSFGFRVGPDGDSWPQKNLREVHSAELIEVSPVTFPAYGSSVAVARSMPQKSKQDKKSRIKIHSDGLIIIEQDEDLIDWTGGILS
jgi:HK97 family phage prohead protease